MEEYYVIKPQELLDLLKYSDGKIEEITRLKRFGGKKLYVDGKLDLSRLPISSLGKIGYVNGTLDISHTNISDIEGVTVTGSIWDSGSKREAIRKAKILREKKDEQQAKRDDKEWDLENVHSMDQVGLRANALLLKFENERDYNVITDEIREELKTLNERLETLTQQQEEENSDDLENKIEEIENRIIDIETDYIDVYDLYEKQHDYYGMSLFEVLTDPDKEYAVIETSEIDSVVNEWAKDTIDDIGVESFSNWTINDCLTNDAIKSEIEDFYDRDVRDSPDSYFTDEDFVLTDEQEGRIEELKNYIEEMNDLKSEIEEKQSELEDEIEEPDEYSEKWDELQKQIDEIEENIVKAQEELDEIEPDTEPTEEMIDDKVTEMVDERMDDPRGWINEMGYDVKDYIDIECLVQTWVNSDGYGIMNSYDGTYDETKGIDNDYYVIMRIN